MVTKIKKIISFRGKIRVNLKRLKKELHKYCMIILMFKNVNDSDTFNINYYLK